jgi:hypothetical protein
MTKPPWYQGRLWSGMCFFAWMRLLARNRFAVGFTRLPMALAITLLSVANTLLRWLQRLFLGRRVARTRLTDDPLFIIGHWRTGTTMLHELLALDKRHRAPTTYECLAPNHFLISERLVKRWLRFVIPRKRPFDNMRMGFDLPQEDEAALAIRGLPSPFLTVAFPNRPLQHARYVDLERLSARELRRWQRGLIDFLKEITYRKSGRIILKSPQHTFRLPVLTAMFPAARFVHIVRDPYVVFPSTVYFWKTMYEGQGLQRPTFRGLDEFVFETFSRMHDKLEQTRHLVDPMRFYELRYEDLIRDPVGQMRALYDYLQLGDFEVVEPAIQRYTKRVKNYQTNRYKLSSQLRDEITRRWRPYIEKYQYVR